MVSFGNFQLEFINLALLPLFSKVLILVFLLGLAAIFYRYSWLKEFSSDLSFKELGRTRFKKLFCLILIDLILITGLGFLAMEVNLFEFKRVPDREKLDISIWIDASLSSLARDITKADSPDEKISRLEFEKEEVINLAGHLSEDFLTIGVFAARASVLMSAVLIHDFNKERIMVSIKKKLDQLSPRIIRTMDQGTNIGSVIHEASMIRIAKGWLSSYRKIIIILTDGERIGNEGVLSTDLTKAFHSYLDLGGSSLYIVGIGNPFDPPEGSVIPAYSSSGAMKVEVDKKGNVIFTRPDYKFLDRVAKRLVGNFVPAKGGDELAEVLEEIMSFERKIIGEKKIKIEHPEIVKIIAFIVLFLLILVNPFQKMLE